MCIEIWRVSCFLYWLIRRHLINLLFYDLKLYNFSHDYEFIMDYLECACFVSSILCCNLHFLHIFFNFCDPPDVALALPIFFLLSLFFGVLITCPRNEICFFLIVLVIGSSSPWFCSPITYFYLF